MIETTAICDSTNPQGDRLHTQLWQYPKFLHQESLRHRTLYIQDCLYDPDFSFSVSSARAIPFAKLLAEVRDDATRAAPEYWGAEQKGMSPGGEVDHPEVAKMLWGSAAHQAANWAEELASQGIHKSICNRIIEPYIHVNCLTTGTTRGWMNFFGLRLDKAADPTLQVLARAAWKVWNESVSQKLEPGQWHLPFVERDDWEQAQLDNRYVGRDNDECWDEKGANNQLIHISVARCARLSYLSFETNKRSTIEEDLKLYDRLVGSSPIHASPAEHQATPDTRRIWPADVLRWEEDLARDLPQWNNLHQAGNLGPGWRQYRRLLPNQEVAPLPTGYK